MNISTTVSTTAHASRLHAGVLPSATLRPSLSATAFREVHEDAQSTFDATTSTCNHHLASIADFVTEVRRIDSALAEALRYA